MHELASSRTISGFDVRQTPPRLHFFSASLRETVSTAGVVEQVMNATKKAPAGCPTGAFLLSNLAAVIRRRCAATSRDAGRRLAFLRLPVPPQELQH